MKYESLAKLHYSDPEHYDAIYTERFHANNAIHFDFDIHEHPAFLLLTPDICDKMISVYEKDKKLALLSRALPGKALSQFTRRCLIDEIILSNNIEGVHSSRKEINEVLAEADKSGKNKRFKGLVQKYTMLQQPVKFRFESCEDIRALYDDLVFAEIAEDSPDNLPDGKLFRKDSTSVLTAAQKEIHRGITPESKIITAMQKALAILNDDTLQPLLRISVFHYLFGYIHPFYDGNGRTSRFISSYLLSHNFEPVLGYRLSYTIKENIKKYYDAFSLCNNPRNSGDLTPFAEMFLDIILKSMQQLYEALDKRLKKLTSYHDAIERLFPDKDPKWKNIFFLLTQAGLFADADSGISMKELIEMTTLSHVTVSNRLHTIDPELLIVNKQGNTNYYQLNLTVFDKMIFHS